MDDGMDDDAFLHAFETGALPNRSFHHRDHLRMAWLYIRRHGVEVAAVKIAEGLRRFAAGHGVSALYHETMTVFWVRLVAHVVAAFPDIERFDDLLQRYRGLEDASLPYRHWRRETLQGAAARRAWMEPDLVALPF